MSNTTRDQERARHAYACVGKVSESDRQSYRQDYRIAVMDLGSSVRRLGLAGATALIEQDARKLDAASSLLEHLSQARVSGLEGSTGRTLPADIRALDFQSYMLATREILHITTWFKRAVQVLIPNQNGGSSDAQ